MTKLRYLILLFLISNVFSSECNMKNNPSGSKDCKDLAVEEGAQYCCFLKVKQSGKTLCLDLSKTDYDNIEDTISKLEDNEEDGKVDELDCKNDYIKFYLFSLLLLILL